MRSIKEVIAKLDNITSLLEVINAKLDKIPVVNIRTSGPLLVTLNAIENIGRPATAEEISRITGRVRALESGYLNKLWMMGIVKKERIKRSVLYTKVT